MNAIVERNNIYFLFEKNNPSFIYLLIKEGINFWELNSNCFIGNKDELYDDENIVIAPIDILLYHLPNLEYLHKDYSDIEREKRKNNTMVPNVYRKAKYLFNSNDLQELEEQINLTDTNQILQLITLYKDYFQNRKKDSVLRIYTTQVI